MKRWGGGGGGGGGGGVKVKFCLFLISILDGGLWYASGPGCFTPEERAIPPTSALNGQ